MYGSHVLVGVFCMVLLAASDGCDAPPPDKVPVQPVAEVASGRVTVMRLGCFDDKTAYCGQRVIYLVQDKTTGSEFIGITGVGISEVGSHKSGKSSVKDER